MKEKILVIEDDDHLRETFCRILAKDGYLVDASGDYASAVELIESNEYDAIFTDINLSGNESGMDILAVCNGKRLSVPIIIITGFPSIDSATEAIRLGGYDYVCKPVERNVLLHLARGAVRHNAVKKESERSSRNLEAVFQSVSDAILSVDSRMVITNLNQAADGFCIFHRSSIGRPFGEIPGCMTGSACDDECRRKLINAVAESMETDKPVELYKYECAKKKRAVYTMKVTPLTLDHGNEAGAVIAMRDETRLAALERDLDRRRNFHHLIIGKSEAMQATYNLIESLSEIRSTILITGESGTGKELVATALHHAGSRRHKPLVKVNCSALAETVLESELFGHVRGAFTGATHDRVGRFEKADGGTIFLDEIGDISPLIQLKLLRALQEKEIERVGDSRPIKVDVRILAATNRDLKQMVVDGSFREDLYYRIKVIEMKIPPLRNRREDIPLLIDSFLDELCTEFSKRIDGVSSDVMELFMNYGWPGNVRELKHIIEHGAILCKHSTITLGDLPDDFGDITPIASKVTPVSATMPADAETLLQILEEKKWNKSEVARMLGVSRQTLYRKLRDSGIKE
ncbi:MAG: sigma 54-interacting transcriptional regulator [Syntrophobacter sp.]